MVKWVVHMDIVKYSEEWFELHMDIVKYLEWRLKFWSWTKDMLLWYREYGNLEEYNG